MQTYLNMGNHFIKTPVNNDQGVNKSYADTKLSLSGGVMQDNLDMNNNRIYNLAQPNGNNQPATKKYTDTNFLFRNGDSAMAGPLNMSNNRITNVVPAISERDGLSRITADG